MPIYKKFGPADQIDNVLTLHPQWNVVSGSAGWRGSPEGSASVTLGGGLRRVASCINTVSYQPTWPQSSFGYQSRTLPQTASINTVWLTNEELSLAEQSSKRWGRNYFNTLMRLYDYYHAIDPDYTTSSYDNYCLYFQKGSTNLAHASVFGVGAEILSSSFTFESWVKPFSTSSAVTDFTIASIKNNFWIGITGSTGKLAFSSSAGIITSSFGLNINRWNHVALTSDGAVCSFIVNVTDFGSIPYAYNFVPSTSYTASLTIGSSYVSPLSSIGGGLWERGSSTAAGTASFHGFIGETRFWNGVTRTQTQISSSYNTRLSSSLTGAFLCYYMSDGSAGFFNEFTAVYGSGVMEQHAVPAGDGYNLSLSNFNNYSPRPVWHPNDNTSIIVPKSFTAGTPPGFAVVDIPSAFYGKQIAPNSVSMTCRAMSGIGLVRTIIDDGRGGLFISGSVCSSSIANKEDYRGVEWNKVGNVFYNEGLIVIKDPTILDFGGINDSNQVNSLQPRDVFQLSFRGTTNLPTKTLMCRIDRGEINASLNSTFYEEQEDSSKIKAHASSSIYITTVGVYNSDHELVGVARLAEPVRVRPRDRLNIKIKCDF